MNEIRTTERYASVLSIAFERLRLQAELRHAAVHDGLTGLANRAAFMARLTDTTDGNFALLYLDLDGFKPINDRWGHGTGDSVLAEIGRRIAATVQLTTSWPASGATSSPYSCRNADPIALLRWLESIVDAVARPISVDDEELVLGVSVGIATGQARRSRGAARARPTVPCTRPRQPKDWAAGGSPSTATAASLTGGHPLRWSVIGGHPQRVTAIGGHRADVTEDPDFPLKIVTELRSVCLRLPEAYEEQAWVGTRWRIRKRTFAHVLVIEGRTGP